MNNRPTIEQIAMWNAEAAHDQRRDYDDQSENETGEWYEGDAYLQNTADTVREYGYKTHSNWEEAINCFYKFAEELGLRFAN